MQLEHLGAFASGEHDARIESVGERLVLVGGGGLEVWDAAALALVVRIAGLPPGHVEEDEESFPGESEPHGTGRLRVAADVAISWGGLRNVTAWRLDAGSRGARFFHGSEVTDAVLARDGGAVISSAHASRELVRWDPITGEVRTRFEHPPLVSAGELAACPACIDARREWEDDDETCAEHRALVEHNCAGALAMSPDGRRLVSGGTGICAWDLDGGWLGMMSRAPLAFTIAVASSGRTYAISEGGREGRSLGVWSEVGGDKIAEVLLPRPDLPVSAILPGASSVLLHTQLAAELHDLDGALRSSFEPPTGAWLRLPDEEHLVVEAHQPPRLIVARIRDGAALHSVERPEGSHLRAVDARGIVAVTHGETVHLYRAMVAR